MVGKRSLGDDVSQLPEVISIAERLRKGEVLSLHGIPEMAKGFLINLLTSAMACPTCVTASSVKQQELLYSEIDALAFNDSRATKVRAFLLPEVELEFLSKEFPDVEILPDLEAVAGLLDTLQSLQVGDGLKVVVATPKSMRLEMPSPKTLKNNQRTLKVGDKIDDDSFLEELVRCGYERENQVDGRGQFAKRGGIIDIFSIQGRNPVRLEFNGDVIDSIRRFDVETQESVETVSETELTMIERGKKKKEEEVRRLGDYLPDPHLLWREPSESDGAVEVSLSNGLGARTDVHLEIFSHEFLAGINTDTVLQEQRRKVLFSYWKEWVAQEWKVLVCCNNEGEEKRLKELLSAETGVTIDSENIQWIQSPLSRGFSWPAAKLVILSDAEIFGRYQSLRLARLQQKMARAHVRREVLDFSKFAEGDFVVHVYHGIGRFLGIQKLEVAGCEQEVLSLEYADEGLLHVPLEQAHLVGRYVGIGKAHPVLDQIGGTRWKKVTAQAQRAVMDYAAEILKVEAERKGNKGFAFAPDHEWQKEFEDAFLFDETQDQLTAIADAKENMESDRPMDRLICGDVGFGKTEVAIRAAFKAVMNGKQVAVLVPTTVLAQQHEQTFRERMADYPVRVDLVSRFRSKKEQRKTLAAAKEGNVDILIGTHRLLQPDVVFKDLGLVIIDEEQRFGVKHKEQFKKKFNLVDLLTLSATPIPRTLYLSLMGAKEISTIETPPVNRLPVETVIAAYDERLIRAAVERELARGGQVYFLHNRVQSIEKVRERILDLVPGARVEIGHGQMDEDDLEDVMMRFVKGDIDVLVATTIIESGLDIPRANTMIIDRADRFGLADLYQLRGRVGRSQIKAYAYLLLPRHMMLQSDARKRVSAIKQYSHLGAGFKIAMRDLEIRGAGNILGTEQSGHATAIGFELYCQLLKETLARMKGEKVNPRVEIPIQLDFLPMSEDRDSTGTGAYIPRSYLNESQLRIEAYRHLAEVNSEKDYKKLTDRWLDRFGKFPSSVDRLLMLTRIRLAAAAGRVRSVEVKEDKVMLRKGGEYILLGGKFPRLKPMWSNEQKLNEILKLVGSLSLSDKKEVERRK